MPNIFERLVAEKESEGNVFERMAQEPQGNIFERLAAESKPQSIADPWYLKKISLPDFVDKEQWRQGVKEIETSAERIKEALINPEAPYGAVEAGINLGTMAAGVPAVGFGHMVDLVTDGKYKVAEKVSEKMIYEPQTESGQVIRDILFAPFIVAGKVGEKRADTLFEELKGKYGETDVRTALYPTIRKTIWDIVGLVATGKALHIPRVKGREVPITEVEPLDTAFARGEIEARRLKEHVEVPRKPLETLVRKEEGLGESTQLEAEVAYAERKAELEQVFRAPETGDPLITPREEFVKSEIPPKLKTEQHLTELPHKDIPLTNNQLQEIVKDVRKLYPEAKGVSVVGTYARVGEKISKAKSHDVDILIKFPENINKVKIDTRFDDVLWDKWRPDKVGVDVDFLKRFGEKEPKYGQHTWRLKKGLPTPEVPIWVRQLKRELVEPIVPETRETLRARDEALREPEVLKPETGMPLLKPEELAPGAFRKPKEVVSDINTALGERGSLFGEKTPEQVAAIDRLKGDIDNIRFAANERGKTIEKYLLDKKHDPRVAYSIHKYAEEALTEARPVEVKIEEAKPEELKTSEELVREFSRSPQPGSAAQKLKNTKRDIFQYARSPQDVYNKAKEIGRKIYDTLDHSNQEFNAWAWKHIGEFTKKIRGIKKGSISAETIGKALDGQLTLDHLTRREKRIHDYLKERFDFLINFYARQKVGSEAKFAQIAGAARKYVDFTDQLREIKGDKTLKNLSKTKLEEYNSIQKKQRQYMKKIKLEDLSPGEREALDLLSRKIHDYLPHLFDKDRLMSYLKADRTYYEAELAKATKQKRITRYKNAINSTNEAISRLEGGEMITYKQLPREVHNRFFKPRKGRAGYSYDAIAAYEAYIYGMGRKLFYDPAIRKVAGLHRELPADMRDYNTWYVRNFLGMDRPAFQDLAGTIVAFQWMRTMGLNPRSAIVNLTQRMNTVAEVGAKYSLRGEKFAFTKEGKELFDKTGIAREIPNIIFEGPVPKELIQAKAVVGYLFNKIELGNRRHAYLSATLKAREGKISIREALDYKIRDPKNMSSKQIHRYATDVVHRTQFRYGKVGMPRVLQTSTGRVAGQFTSFTIKQLELINHWRKHDPLKLVKWVAMAEGGNILLQKFMDTDLSNALGFGVNWAEALEMLKAIPEADFRKMYRQWRLTFGGGSGVLPTGPGPTVTGAYKTFKAMSSGRGWKQLKKELTPVQYKRLRQGWLGLQKREGDLFPIYNTDNHLMYRVTARELIQRTFGPAPAKEGKKYGKWLRERLFEQEHDGIIRDMVQAIADGKSEKFNSLVEKYGIVPTDEQIVNEIYRRKLTLEERSALESIDKRRIYQMRQEKK